MLRQLSTPQNSGRISGFGLAAAFVGSVGLLLTTYFGCIVGKGDTRGFLHLPVSDGTNVRVAMLLAAGWFVAFALPLLLTLTGLAPASPPTVLFATASPLELTELGAASVAVSLLLRLVKFPASWMFGAMIGSSVLHGAGLVEGGLPPWARGIALVGIGAVIGARFARMRIKTLLGHLNASLGSFAIAIAISGIFVAFIAFTTHVHFADIVVAFAPGAMDAMLALALTLHIDPIFVGAHHLSRFVFVTIATPGIVHLFGRPQEDVDD